MDQGSQEAAKVADKLIDVLAEPFLVGDQVLSISGSIGVSHFPQDGAEADVLLKNADAAMYRARSWAGITISSSAWT